MSPALRDFRIAAIALTVLSASIEAAAAGPDRGGAGQMDNDKGMVCG